MALDEAPRPLGLGTAPGKVILLGEHAVVYGAPALAVPVSAVEARATVWPGAGPLSVRAFYPQREGGAALEVRLDEAPDTDALATAARCTLDFLGLGQPPAWAVDLASTVPTGRGLGSSAATAVALVRALGAAAGRELSAEEAGRLAFEAERVTHGRPSGIDNTVVALGRPIRFERGAHRPLGLRLPLTLLIADSGQPGDTRAMVEGVQLRHARRPAAYGGWFERIRRLVDEATVALAEGDLPRLGRLMNANHLALQAMRVSTPALDRLVAAARGAGALGAKLSGSGGGGIVIALVAPEQAAAVGQAFSAAGAGQVLRTVVEAGPSP
jgi:mevalonate kinase